MEKSKKVSAGLGPDSPKVFTLDEVKVFVKRDVQAALLLLDAIYRDQNTCDMVAEYLHGRYMNSKHKDELLKQQDLKL